MDELHDKRHSLAHLLGAALVNLYPGTHLAIGPATSDGFYYDAKIPKQISDKDLKTIENKMREIYKTWNAFEIKEVSKEKALEFFSSNPYKKELIEEIFAKGEKLTFVSSGGFIDFCRGNHVSSMKDIPVDSFVLSRVAAASWKGDETKDQLTRIYGFAFNTKKELSEYLILREEAEKRNHRILGKEHDLFTFSPLVGPGLPMFTPKGTAMRKALTDYIHLLTKKYGYEEVWIPHLTKKDLYEKSGHWEKFGDELFKVKGKDDSLLILKPMNCPHHTQLFDSSPKSYRDLPVRYAEVTTVYRDEKPGELLGLSRVRSITQDDGHIFCTPEQIEYEIEQTISFVKEFYVRLNLFKEGNYFVSLSVRGEDKEYLGNEKMWGKSESILEALLKKHSMPYERVVGEAAFYGPKIDFVFKDAIGRPWQLATIQLDFVMPERFKLSYTTKEGKKQTPVMIHRAITGSLERFFSVIIEHFAGAFPFWLSPVQVAILPVSEKHIEYAEEVAKLLKEGDIRVTTDVSNESVSKKIYKTKKKLFPYFIVLGDEEVTNKTVTVQSRDGEKTTKPLGEVFSLFPTE